MNGYTDCIAHNSSDCRLLTGETRTAVFDCGMMFCAEETVRMAADALNGRALDYIFITHTHYDHIGALPYFREKWPQARLVASDAGAAILLKDTPRRVIRELSAAAAEKYGAAVNMEYGDDVFHADIIVKDGDAIPLGGVSAEVVETPGHTRDSLSYFIPELELLILNETPGVLMPDGSVYPCFLTGYDDTVNSIKKCRHLPYRYLSLPHRGIASERETDGFFERALEVNAACRDFILNMLREGLDEDIMLYLFNREYGSDVLSGFQPKEAFIANAKAMFARIRIQC